MGAGAGEVDSRDFVCFIFKIYLFIFRKRGREGEREEEKHQCMVASACPQLGIWPETQTCAWESNQQPFGSQAGTQFTEPHQPGLEGVLFFYECYSPSEGF